MILTKVDEYKNARTCALPTVWEILIDFPSSGNLLSFNDNFFIILYFKICSDHRDRTLD